MIPSAARCGAHPEVAAVDVCKRCGRFLCGECVELVGENAYCTACAARVEAPAPLLGKLALGVAGAGWVMFATFLFIPRLLSFAGVLVLLPGLFAFAAMVTAQREWLLIRRGESSSHGRSWAFATLAVATPLFLLMAGLVLYGLLVTIR